MTLTYSKGTRVWVRHDVEVWVSAEIAEESNGKITATAEDGSTHTFDLEKDPPPLRNPDILEGADDMTGLSYLHEPAVLNTVSVRYTRQIIYTYCGIVLVAMNPYHALPLYSNDVINAYHGKTQGELEPHIFAVAEEAFKRMDMEGRNQSIIVSGESGAGKTVNAKYVMRYFAMVGAGEVESIVEKKILATNPIMEAFGNAKTTRNDNSSRFGKYCEIQFDQQNRIIGASIRTYLLEKSRVVFQADDERNYHIFYQLCNAAYTSKCPELEDLELDSPQNFFYCSQGGNMIVNGVDDASDYDITKQAMELTGIPHERQVQMFRMLAAILHLGNIEVKAKSKRQDDAYVNVEEDKHLAMAAKLLGVEKEPLAKWICNRKIVTVGEAIVTAYSSQDGINSRDALSKLIYAKLFDWIVERCNQTLSSGADKFIGVLDIYGFETFKVNSFEQFCINYANEKLQQLFNQHVFKLEQDEYVREEIQWSFIDFYDNQPCLELIESKLGVLSLLDEESRLPRGSDGSFANKLYDNLTKLHHFKKPRMGQSAFIVKHYAADVTYETTGFIEKNKDACNDELVKVVRTSSIPFVTSLLGPADSEANTNEAPKPAGGKKLLGLSAGGGKKRAAGATVGSQFKDSLGRLMDTIHATTPHYVRCIKPNQQKKPFVLEPVNCIEQLRACGVLETVRISAAGYPSRWSYPEFCERYRPLLQGKETGSDDRELAKIILTQHVKEEDKFQFGVNKIFFRAGEVAFLEKLRAEKLKKAIVKVQKQVRMFLQKKHYLRIRKATMLLQRIVRGMIARNLCRNMRRAAAAVCIQKRVRGYIASKKYKYVLLCVVKIQSCIRSFRARKAYVTIRKEHYATIIQKNYRAFAQRKKFKRNLKDIVLVQCCYRKRKARRMFKILKAEAKSVSKLQQATKGLENKIMKMQNKMDDIASERDSFKAMVKKLEEASATEKVKLEEEKNKNDALAAEKVVALQSVKDLETKVNELQTANSTMEETISGLTARIKEVESAPRASRSKSQALDDSKDMDAFLANAESDLYANDDDFRKRYDEQLAANRLLQRKVKALEATPSGASAIEMDKLRIENDRYHHRLQKVIAKLESAKLREKQSTAASIDIKLQKEVQRLTRENLALREEMEGKSISVPAVEDESSSEGDDEDLAFEDKRRSSLGKRHSRMSSIDSDFMDGEFGDSGLPARKRSASVLSAKGSTQSTPAKESKDARVPVANVPVDISSGSQEFLGLLVWEEKDEQEIINRLIVNLKPQHLANELPGLIAHILFMCVRYADHNNSPRQLQGLLTAAISSIKHVVMKNSLNLNFTAFWLANLCRLVSDMRSYSGELQNVDESIASQTLKNFDLSEYREVLSDVIVQIYHTIVKHIQELLAPMIVPAFLDSEPSGMVSSKPATSFGHKSSAKTVTASNVFEILSSILEIMRTHYVEPNIIQQIFEQIIYFIGTTMLNNLMLRKDLCHWSKGIQIRYNLTLLADWVRDSNIKNIKLRLESITEAAQLLQMDKTRNEDVELICETCKSLNALQIQKLLVMYTPGDYEEKVPASVIRAVGAMGADNADPSTLMMETSKVFALKIPFSPTELRLNTISMPSFLNLGFLKMM
eukprot:Nk52_evm70s215 gene=Nk52_evmTU70s215